jgi:hypothetical protein
MLLALNLSSSSVVPLAVAIVAAGASVAAALVSVWNASQSRRSQAELEQIRILEARVASLKTDVYRPMVNALNDALAPDSATQSVGARGAKPKRSTSDHLAATTHEFAAWLAIVGSDDAVRTFHNFLQSAFHDAPPAILLRMYAEFVLAARRDMGDQNTAVGVADVLGMRITDLYDDPDLRSLHIGTLQDLADDLEWKIPWTASSTDSTLPARPEPHN